MPHSNQFNKIPNQHEAVGCSCVGVQDTKAPTEALNGTQDLAQVPLTKLSPWWETASV